MGQAGLREEHNMESILCLVHTDSTGALPKPAFEALAVAKDLAAGLGGASIDVGLIGADVAAAGNAVAVQLPGFVDEPLRFGEVAGRLEHPHRLAGTLVGAQVLAQALAVVADQSVG